MSAPEIPFLAGLDAAAVSAVRARMVSMAVPAGRTLFGQGDAGDALYTLVSGAVGVSTGAVGVVCASAGAAPATRDRAVAVSRWNFFMASPLPQLPISSGYACCIW